MTIDNLSQTKVRFLEKVIINPSSNCWEWIGTIFTTGYACFWFEGKNRKASRIAYEIFKGPITPGLCVLHFCDNRLCVNPDHLWLGSNADNSNDMKTKGRSSGGSPPGERNGKAKLTNVLVTTLREEFSRGNMTQVELGKKYGITSQNVGQIISRKHWKHIP